MQICFDYSVPAEVVIKSKNSQPNLIQLQNNSLPNIDDRRTVISNLHEMEVSYSCSGDVFIENVNQSKVVISGNLISLRINHVSDSTIEVNSICCGAIYIENVQNGKLKIAGDQIRLHDCVNVDIVLFTRSSCILEDCENLRFHPNRDAASAAEIGNLEESYWRSIQDFGFNPEASFTLVEFDE